MTIKKKVPLSSCYLSGELTSDGDSGLTFELLEDEDDEADEEEDDDEDEESAVDESDEDGEESDSEEEASEDGDTESDEEDDEESDEKASMKRSFSMLAHTGKLISRWWGHMVLDMDGAKYRQKVALIKDHNLQQPLGFSTKIKRTKRGIEATGKMLKNKEAAQVTSYSKQGYPWQASLMAVPTRVENVEPGATSMVNGREVLGPVTIFREWGLHELTLTTLGADDDTTTEAFAADGEIEVEIMAAKKKNPRQATQTLSPHGAAPAAVLNPGEAEERSRATQILESADPSQMELAQELVKSGASLTDALAQLNADLKERLAAASEGLSVHATPLSGGNGGGSDGTGAAASAARLDFSSLPDDPQLLEEKWGQHVELRREFDNKEVFLAFGRNRGRAMHLGSDAKLAEKLGGGLKGLGHRNIQGNYFSRYEDMLGRLWYPRMVTEYATDQDHEIFKWLGNVPNPRPFEGERQRNSLTDYGITVVGEKYDLTVEADVDDVRRDKTGQIMKRIGEMGTKMATLPQRLVSDLIERNGTAYDGLPLYSNAHEVGKSGVQSNDITIAGITNPDKPTSEQMSDVILEGIKSMIGLKDDHGDPANEGAQKFLIVGPTKYMNVAAAALKNDYTSAGVSNTIKSTDFQIDWATNARLNGAAGAAGRRIYIFREDAELRAILMQRERITDAFMSEFDFWADKLAWGGKDILTAAPGRFELTNRINISA